MGSEPVQTTLRFEGRDYPFTVHGQIDSYAVATLDFVSYTIANTGHFFEEPLLRHIWNSYRGLKKVVDIGANIGNHSLFFSEVMDCEVIAFEPFPANFALLKKNAPRAQTHNIALGEKQEIRKPVFGHMADEKGNFSMGNLGAVRLVKDSSGGEEISVQTLDSFNIRDIDLIKIDVEGMEEQVIKGGLKTIEREKPIICAEHHTIQELSNCLALLSPMGYVVTYQYAKGDFMTFYENLDSL